MLLLASDVLVDKFEDIGLPLRDSHVQEVKLCPSSDVSLSPKLEVTCWRVRIQLGIGGALPGFGDQHEMELLVETGFTPLEAIRIATYNRAQ